MRRFVDRVALVTGAAGGIGLAIAQRFHAEGAHVVLADLKAQAAVAAADSLAAAGRGGAIGIACDVSREDQVAAACEAALARWHRLDAVINNAGLMTFKPIIDLTEDDWLRVLRVDLLGAAFFMKHAFRRMKPGSAIVNVSSVHAVETSPDAAPYAAAKAALLSLTRTGSIEGRALGIRVNAVLPGAVDTPMLWSNPNIKSGAEVIDKADVGSPPQLADAILFLASEEAAFVNGASLAVDGGRLARL